MLSPELLINLLNLMSTGWITASILHYQRTLWKESLHLRFQIDLLWHTNCTEEEGKQWVCLFKNSSWLKNKVPIMWESCLETFRHFGIQLCLSRTIASPFSLLPSSCSRVPPEAIGGWEQSGFEVSWDNPLWQGTVLIKSYGFGTAKLPLLSMKKLLLSI